MFPLAGPNSPDSPESLEAAVQAGMIEYGLTPLAIRATGGWPGLDLFRVDLSGSKVDRTQRLPVAKTCDRADVQARRFELVAEPIHIERTPVSLTLQATDAVFGFAGTNSTDALLALTQAAEGNVAIEVQRTALETLLQQLASEAASKQGVDIKRTKLELTELGPRSFAFRAEVTAKMFVMTAAVTLSGQVEVDDQLQARISQLRFAGDGMIANVAGGFIRPQLEKLEGRTFALMAFSLGAIRLRDLQLRAGDSLRITAQFGS